MDAGKKLDEWVARHILGWRNEGSEWFDGRSGTKQVLRPFSTDVTTAWVVADLVCDEGYQLQLSGKRIWQARFTKSIAHSLETKAYSGTGSNPAEAICLAALALKGVEVPK